MVVRTHSRICRATYASVILLTASLVSLTACHQRPESAITHRGDDVLASGSAPQLRDSVTGDAMATGRDIAFSGATGGDYLGAGGKQTISGRIHGTLRAAGGEIFVASTVDRNATVAGGMIDIDSSTVIGRNAYFAGGKIHVNGAVRGELCVAGGTVVLNGPVGGDVQITASELFLGPKASITGSLRYRVPAKNVHRDPLARIAGPVTVLPMPRGRAVGYVFGFLWLLGLLIAGGIVVALLPRFMSDAAALIRELPGRSALTGLAWMILTPIVIVLVACTIIGLPLALFGGLVYVVALCLSRVVSAVWLGRWILGSRARVGRSGAVANFVVGEVILLIVRLIPIVGILVMCVVTVLGFGAFILRVRALRAAGVAL